MGPMLSEVLARSAHVEDLRDMLIEDIVSHNRSRCALAVEEVDGTMAVQAVVGIDEKAFVDGKVLVDEEVAAVVVDEKVQLVGVERSVEVGPRIGN